ncbi:acetoacetate--CoA ligase [Nocardioides sp. SYSU D00038]|uniref:acetoacetate--CoA ligase n=1 Tax=Nocardioides sp. SYSU D00038 TaxID=2812554 RepID=UPI00196783ED|nr:acetoacetate--CoA ligase [Nocardioides sp. SYSU D00038]
MHGSGAQWVPPAEALSSARVVDLARWLRDRGTADLEDPSDFRALQAWSAVHPDLFWEAVLRFFEVDLVDEPTAVLADRRMPGATWFPGATLNFGHHLLRHGTPDRPAVVLVREDGTGEALTFAELRAQVGAVAARLAGLGVGAGDRVVAYLPNCVEGVVAFVACALLGATWSQTGLDYAPGAAADRLAQLEPKVLLAGAGYLFRGEVRDRRAEAHELRGLLPGLEHTIVVPTAGLALPLDEASSSWAEALAVPAEPSPVPLPFDHPLWVLFTSGTTGRPKGIVHGHGGALLEQLALTGLHADLGPDDVYFWYTSPNWMMWNAQVCGLLVGATVVLYDGNPTSPDTDALWRVAADLGVTVLGVSPGYLQACARAGVEPARDLDLRALRTVAVTGSVLPPSGNAWVREHVGAHVQVASMSGGTDVVGVFLAGSPTLPVWDGEISSVALGVALEVWDDDGRPVLPGTAGELVVTSPMPSMPLRFLADPDGSAYRDAYFSTFPGVWRHGDSITLTERGTVVVHGRSDSTLNRHGVRIGSAEIYAAVEALAEVEDSLVVGIELADGGYWMPMFVVAAAGADAGALPEAVRAQVRRVASPRHVPDEVVVVPALPHTRTGKKLEVPVKRILQGADPGRVSSEGAVDDPAALRWLVAWARARRSA